MEIEDDVLFAELSRQLALLIMDDDEQFPVQPPPPLPFPVSLICFNFSDESTPILACSLINLT